MLSWNISGQKSNQNLKTGEESSKHSTLWTTWLKTEHLVLYKILKTICTKLEPTMTFRMSREVLIMGKEVSHIIFKITIF